MKYVQLDEKLSNQLFFQLIEQSSEAIILLDENLNILIFNQKAQNLLNCTKKISNFQDLCSKLNIKTSNHKEQLNKLDRDSSREMAMLIGDVSITWTLELISIKKQRFYLLKTNSSDKKKYEEQIYQLETLLENTPCNVYWVDHDLRMIDCNQNVLTMLNMTREEFKGKTYDELSDICDWPPGLAHKLRSDDISVIKTGIPIIGKEDPPIPHADGSFSQFLTSRVPLRNRKGKIVGIAGISMDISSLKEARLKAEAANQAKTEFLENMRHDIRTPLTGIVGFADILGMEAKDMQIKEYTDNLIASSHALLDLLDEVLEAVRVGSGEIPKLKKKFNFEESLNHIIELYRAKAAQKKIELIIDYDRSIPTYVIGDKVRIHRVALELVGNALNFTDRGYVKLSAELAKRGKQQNLVIKLAVEDTGIGIPKDKQHEIYVQFKRLTPSYKGIYKGVGLGLSVVKQFIDELDAEIYVESETRKGSRFTCFIPVQEPLVDSPLGIEDEIDEELDRHYETTYAHQIKSPITDTGNKEYRVLVVEDNSIAQSVAKSILSQSNCKVDIAE